jgi:hypothetical protein
VNTRATDREQRSPCVNVGIFGMDHLTGPLEQLRDQAAAFLRRGRARLLRVIVDNELVRPAVDLLGALQWLPDAHGPVICLEQAAGGGDRGWTGRATAVRAEHARFAEVYAELGLPFTGVGIPSQSNAGILAFASGIKALADALRSLKDGPKGVVVLLAPGPPADPETWRSDVRELITTPSLASVRWIWVEIANVDSGEAVEGLASGQVATAICRVDPAGRERELDELAEAIAIAPNTAAGPACIGAAWPRAGLPAHVTDRQPAPVVLSGVVPMEGTIDRPALAAMLRAATALRKGDASSAIALQREARDRCVARGLVAESIQMELLLATYTAQASFEAHLGSKVAIGVLVSASARAQRGCLPLLAAMAEIGVGMLARLDGDGELAARSFMKSATLAREAEAHGLEAEALRAAGQLALDARLSVRGKELLRSAAAAVVPEPPLPDAKREVG